MTRIDFLMKKAAGPQCWGAGLVAMDIVEADVGEFAITGGSCGNVMAILAWLGWQAIPVARLGADAAGDLVRRELNEVGVHTGCLTRETGVQTPVVIQRFGKNKDGGRVHRFSLTCPDCGAWLPRHRPITLKQASVVIDQNGSPNSYYFDRVSPGALRLAEIARDQGALVVFEPSSIGDQRKFQIAVDLCHVLKYSQDRLGHVPDLSIAASPKLIIETQGQDGLRFRWRNHWTKLDAFTTSTVVDAAGSGDWCAAGLIHRLGQAGAKDLSGLLKSDLISTLQAGQALAAINCCYFGARGAMLALTLRQLNSELQRLVNDSKVMALSDEMFAAAEPPENFCQLCDSDASTASDLVTSQTVSG